MDVIELRGLRVMGTHGVLPEEHARAQPFEVDLDVEADLAIAGDSDDHAAAPALPGLEGALAPPTAERAPVPVDDRLEGSVATATWALAHGARMVRAHDVRATAQAVRVVAA